VKFWGTDKILIRIPEIQRRRRRKLDDGNSVEKFDFVVVGAASRTRGAAANILSPATLFPFYLFRRFVEIVLRSI
jgi:hypothetical protein